MNAKQKKKDNVDTGKMGQKVKTFDIFPKCF